MFRFLDSGSDETSRPISATAVGGVGPALVRKLAGNNEAAENERGTGDVG
jgi:hypothetical protein